MKRSEINKKYTWDLTHIFKTEANFVKGMHEVKSAMQKLAHFKGTLSTKEEVISYLTQEHKAQKLFEKLFIYAMLSKDINSKDSAAQARMSEVESLGNLFNEATAFAQPEILRLPNSFFDELIADQELSRYDYYFSRLKAQKAYILSDKEEELLTKVNLFSGEFYSIFNAFNVADRKMAKIKQEDGKKVQLTNSLYETLRESKNPKVRRDAVMLRLQSFYQMNETLSASFIGEVKKNWFYSKVRGFKSCLSSALFYEHIPVSVYQNLIKQAENRVDFFQKFCTLKKKVLNLPTLHDYDLYVPLCEAPDQKVSYEQSYELCLEALAPMGAHYQALLKKARDEHWVDVYETESKCTGGYSCSCPEVHPYILLNYAETLSYTSTLAHELGHALHSVYTNETQPEEKRNYSIFAAEVASMTNEILLTLHLADKYKNNKEMLRFVYSGFLDTFWQTFYLQVAAAAFEEGAHKLVEKDKPITRDILNKLWVKIINKQYGKVIKKNKYSHVAWSIRPHMYMNFYVYKYATGIIAALHFASQIYNGNQTVLQKYEGFLRAGGSKSAYDILKDAGVDLDTDAPYNSAFSFVEEIYKKLENLC